LTAHRNISGEDNDERSEWMEELPEASIGACRRAHADIVYFVGCVSSFFPMVQGIPRNMVRILEASGTAFAVLAGEEWCCGYPLVAAGSEGQIAELEAHNVARVREMGASTVVFSCPSCLKTWKEHYHTDLELLHSSQLIVRFVEQGAISLGHVDGSLTYHDPCDLGRQGGEYEAPRKIIRSIPGISFVELNGTASQSICCGGGGNVETANPKLSRLVARKKLDQIKESGADVLVTSCQQCVRTIKGEARRTGDPVHVMDITDIVVKAMDASERRG
jgi:heterodisulfide reductase subunit D